MLLCVLRRTRVTSSGDAYDIKKFKHHPGIYFEEIGTLQQYKDSWKMVIHLDLTPLISRYTKIQHVLTNTTEHCQIIKMLTLNNFCKQFYTVLHKELQQTFSNLEFVNQILGTTTRTRRGLINGIGHIEKILFGTMDTTDRQNINKQIQILKQEGNMLRTSIVDQFQIINANVKLFNESISNINYNEQTLLKATKTLKRLLETQKHDERAQSIIDETAIIIENIVRNLAEDVKNLLQFTQGIKRGILDPTVVSPAKIIDCLNMAIPRIPQGLRLPLSPSIENIPTLYEIIDLTAYSSSHSITTIIEVPLLTQNYYTLNRVYPVPTRINGSIYAFIDITETIIAIDMENQNYIRINNQDLDKCKTINHNHLCKSHHPTFKITPHSSCEILLSVKIIKPNNCNTKIVSINQTTLIELQQSETWIYIAPKPIDVTIVCDQHSIQNLQLQDSGTLLIKKKCTVSTTEFIIETGKSYKSDTTLYYLPSYNLTIPNLSEIVNATQLKWIQNYKLHKIIKHPAELQAVSKNLLDLKADLSATNIIPIEYHYSLITSISTSAIIIITIIIVICYKYIYLIKCNRKNQEENNTKIEMAEITTNSRQNNPQIIILPKPRKLNRKRSM